MSQQLDIQIIRNDSGDIVFGGPDPSYPDSGIARSSYNTGLMLLQRLYIIMLTAGTGAYRKTNANVSLLGFIDGANIP